MKTELAANCGRLALSVEVIQLATRFEEIATGLFYKRRSQEKTHLPRLDFFLLLSPLDRASSVLTYRAMCSVSGRCGPAVWVFSTSGFHRFLATKPAETSKAERWSNLATIVLLKHYDHTVVLQSENTNYESITLSGKQKWKIVAKVLWWIAKAP
jgi:hypothetical protein